MEPQTNEESKPSIDSTGTGAVEEGSTPEDTTASESTTESTEETPNVETATE